VGQRGRGSREEVRTIGRALQQVGLESHQNLITMSSNVHSYACLSSAGISGEMNGPPEMMDTVDMEKFAKTMEINVTGLSDLYPLIPSQSF